MRTNFLVKDPLDFYCRCTVWYLIIVSMRYYTNFGCSPISFSAGLHCVWIYWTLPEKALSRNFICLEVAIELKNHEARYTEKSKSLWKHQHRVLSLRQSLIQLLNKIFHVFSFWWAELEHVWLVQGHLTKAGSSRSLCTSSYTLFWSIQMLFVIKRRTCSNILTMGLS